MIKPFCPSQMVESLYFSIIILSVIGMSGNRSFNLAKLEESILREYKRGAFGEQTPHYQIESIYYSDLPKQLPESIAHFFRKSIVLYNYSYFEMITFAVFEFLFRSPPELRRVILDKVKGKIVSQDFMFGSNYIKGLLVKGIRSVGELGEGSSKPIAQILLKNDAMSAFSQFWKEVLEEQCEESNVKYSDIPEGRAYQYIANFLGVNFQLFWKRENGYEEERVQTQAALTDDFITLVVFQKTLVESIITKILEESIVQEDNERGYVLLLPQTVKPSVGQQGDKKAEFEELRMRGAAVAKKGSELLNRFRQFYREMRDGME